MSAENGQNPEADTNEGLSLTHEGKHPGGRPSKYEPRFCDEVEKAMGAGYSLTSFAHVIGVARSTINEWMANFPEFSEAVSRAKAARLHRWETLALRVAEKGGGPGTATVIVFGLKNMGGDEWSDKQQLEHTGPGGGAIKTEAIISDDLKSALDALAIRVASGAGKA